MSLDRQIRCDGCGEIGDSSLGPRGLAAHVMRKRLRSRGWRTVTVDGPCDFCPACAAAGVHREARWGRGNRQAGRSGGTP